MAYSPPNTENQTGKLYTYVSIDIAANILKKSTTTNWESFTHSLKKSNNNNMEDMPSQKPLSLPIHQFEVVTKSMFVCTIGIHTNTQALAFGK